ncbi:MAG: adenosylcobinamide-phosphate synthase CbiB [Pseudorhodobacter sp.]
MTAALLFFALLLDAVLGEPPFLWSRFPHPAVVMGRGVAWADGTLNHGAGRRIRGIIAMGGLAALAGLVGWGIALIPDFGILEIAAAAILLAQRSLADHVRAVARALRQSVDKGRQAVAQIVGRDTAAMEPPDIARAAIESAAENLSDGVIAPAFWFLIGGLPAMAIYKMVNTADSMIGHRTPRHAEFGWAAARLDDVLNWLPARITAGLIVLSHGRIAVAPILRDAGLHRSPNAGWPEAAMAFVLNTALSGPRSYGGAWQDFPYLWPEGQRTPNAGQIDAAVMALWRAWALFVLLVGGITIL